jgi:putative oxidoreductase
MAVEPRIKPLSHSRPASAALLLLRLIAGSAFVIHGWAKMHHPASWGGPNSPFPGFLQFLAAISEFFGGIAWIVGLVTPFASLGIGFTMAVAVETLLLSWRLPFVSQKGGPSYELAAAYLAISAVLLALGPGKYSLDSLIFGERSGTDKKG